MNAMEVTNLTKLYGDFVAVDALSFSLRQGEVLGLVGPNGAGKTTTLRAIVGIHPPTRGSVTVRGFNLETDPVEAKRRIGFVPDEPRLFEYLTVEEHLNFVSRIYGLADWRPVADDLLQELELDDRRRSVPGSLAGFCLLLLAWAWPGTSTGLGFTEAEIQFLFPAPLTRRQVVLYRVARAQTAILSTTVIVWLVGASGTRFIGLWFFFIVLDLYLLMAKLGRARLKQLRIGFFLRAIVVLLILIGFFALGARHLGPVLSGGKVEMGSVMRGIAESSSTFPMSAVLFIPALFVRPLIAPTIPMLATSAASLGIAGIIFFLMARWLDVSFEDASIAGARRKAEQMEKKRQVGRGAITVRKRMPQPFSLSPSGPPEVAIVWKNLISAARFSWVPVLLIALGVLLAASTLAWVMHWEIALMTGTIVCACLGVLTAIAGPIFVQADLRNDSDKLDILKSFPLEGKRLVGAEIAGCFVAVTAIQLLYLLAVLMFSFPVLGFAKWTQLAAWGPAGVLLGSAATLIQVTVQNAALLLFPAWMATAKTGRGGIERAGSNLLLLLVQLLILGISVIPAGAVFGLSFWLCERLLHFQLPAVALFASIPAVMMLLAEFWVALEFLGARFDELDIAAELSPG